MLFLLITLTFPSLASACPMINGQFTWESNGVGTIGVYSKVESGKSCEQRRPVGIHKNYLFPKFGYIQCSRRRHRADFDHL